MRNPRRALFVVFAQDMPTSGAWTYQNARLVEVPLGGHGTLHVEQKLDGPLPTEADGTNYRMWPTATVLSNYLAKKSNSIRGKRVVELGSGSGAVGLACLALGAEFVAITDVAEALPLICDNVQRNAALFSGRSAVLPCTWGNDEHISALLAANGGRGFDVVIACEVVYKQSEEVLQALAATQQQLMARPGGVSLLAYEYRGELFDDLAYFDAANERFECEPFSLRDYEGELLDAEYEDSRWLYTYTLKE